ncbi:MAG: hypothetical protein WCC26_21820 [Terracidiphilus sp.]
MTLLRAISDRFSHVVSADPDSMQEESADRRRHAPDGNPTASHAWPAIETEIPHCCFYCHWCGATILLPHEGLGLPFGGPLIRRIEARSIGTVCRDCGHVGVYSLFRGSQGFNTRSRFVPSRPEGKTVLVGWLHCEEPTCTFPLPFFVTLEDGAPEQRVKELAAAWNWEELMCTAGHEIVPPHGLVETVRPSARIDLRRVETEHPH